MNTPEHDFQKEMEEKYPLMYGGRYGGFAISPGWHQIVRSLSGTIQYHIDSRNEDRDKYQQGDGCPQVVVAQVKEKFGGLRFYYRGGDDVIRGMVRMAESWAARTCEICGSPGELRSGTWLRTLCDEHDTPVDTPAVNTGLELAVIGVKHFGNPIPKEWYAAARELLEQHKS